MDQIIKEEHQQPKSDVINQLEDLKKQGRYVDAYRLAVTHWGEFDTMTSKEQLLQLIAVLDRVGLGRSGDAIRYRLHRQYPDDPEVALRAAYLYLYSRGPATVWELADKHLSSQNLSKQQRAEWLLLKCLTASTLRDFENAQELHEEAGKHFKDDWWHRVLGYVLTDKEEYTKALDYLLPLYQSNPSEGLLLQIAKTLSFAEQESQAIELLAEESPKYQSHRPWFHLAHLYKECGEREQLIYALQQAEENCVQKDKQLIRNFSYLYGYVALEQGDFETARTKFLENNTRYSQVIAENILTDEGNKKVRLDVPFIKQGFLTCAPASIAAVLNYLGQSYTQEEIAKEVCYDGTPDYLQHEWLDKQNIAFIEFDLEWSLAKQLIDRDLPFTFVTRSGNESHMQVVTGYNEKTGVLYLMDPSSPGVTEILAKLAIEMNASVGPRCMVLLPEKTTGKVDGLIFPAEVSYQHYRAFSQHIRQHNLEQARDVLQQMKQHSAQQRLTLMAERSLAIELQDEYLIESSTSQLLEKFPDEPWLITSRFYALNQLGRRREALAFLHESFIRTGQQELLETWLLEVYEIPEYSQAVKEQVNRLHRMALYYAESNWILGHLYWFDGKHDLARRHYRWSITLNDRDERYTESYFKSCIWNGRQKSAARFLKQRWENYREKSSGPAISFFNALSFMDLEHQGMNVLRKSAQLRPNDDYLISFYLRKLIEFGEYREFKKIYSEKSSILHRKDALSIKAEYFYVTDQHNKAEAIYEQLIVLYPSVAEYYRSLFRLQLVKGEQVEIDRRLDELLEKIGFAPFSAWLIADWHSDSKVKEKLLSALVNEHPGDVSAVSRYAQMLIARDDFEQAKACLSKHLSEHTQSAELLALLSNIELRQDNIKVAQDYAWQAIEKNIDSDAAFDALIYSHMGIDERKLMLQRLWTLLKANLSSGDFLWNYWHIARAWLEPKELQRFCSHIKEKYSHSWYSYVLVAKQFVDENKIDEAEKTLLAALKKFPLLPRVHFELGEIYVLKNDIEKAIESFLQVLIFNPSWAQAARRLAELYEKVDDIEASQKVLEKACRYNSHDGILFGLRADLKLKQEKQDEALELLVQAVSKDTEYNWGWRTLQSTGEMLGRPSIALDTATKLTEESPRNSSAWIALSRLVDSPENCEDALLRGLEQTPRAIDLRRELIEFYIDSYQFEKAQEQLDSAFWQGNPPLSIHALKASIFARQGRYGEAIEWLENFLKSHDNYYDGWEKLHHWYLNFGMPDKAISAAKKMVDHAPHQARTLSVSAETLFEQGDEGERAIAAQWLEKAFNLEPADLHVSLSWLDYLLDHERYQEAEECEQIVLKFYQHALLDVRRVRRLVHTGNRAAANDLIPEVIEQNVDNAWIYFQLIKWCSNKSEVDATLALLKEKMKQPDCCEAIATAWAYQVLDSHGSKPISEYLENNDYSTVWNAVANRYFRALEDSQRLPPKKFMKEHRSAILQDTELFAIYGFLLCQKGRYREALDWYRERNLYEIGVGYIWYHKRWAEMENGDWKSAQESIIQAIQCPPDNCYSNICLWFAYFKLVAGNLLSNEDLININEGELTPLEQYVFSLVLAMNALEGQPVDTNNKEFWHYLRQAQHRMQGQSGNPMAADCKRHIRQLLRSRIPDVGFFNKLSLRFKLHNHF
ncbi:tetratricopeptide repeat protein [Pleionea litopenaei]|uniref:Tetratricopeptide repeat protein n=1 Tax=Pleionea litopenaei TaxID=3070815 RepID=A0AA51RSE0_9GAMM|nr:tetratricopeptide repeat protein [Pleionea sp. HL-JVS1]WMS86787.1 tetratricopeptide repeat protein [Pleionea sp. HL-JVS1]